MTRVLLARTVLVVAALAALGAAASTLLALADATDDALRVAETSRGLGLGFFAGAFLVLARRPRENVALWLLVIANKVLLTVAMTWWWLEGTSGAGLAAASDGVLTAILLVTWLLVRPSFGACASTPSPSASAPSPTAHR